MNKSSFSQAFLDRVKDQNNLLQLVGESVVLRKSGANYTGLCPFHSERTPSFSVSETKQLYHCHGCKRGGDQISFMMEWMGLSFTEAVEELAERARIPLPKDWKKERGGDEDPAVSAQRQKQSTAYKLNRFTAAFFHSELAQSPSVLNYLAGRGTQNEWIQSFYLGAASPAWDRLSRHLSEKKAPLDLAAELGLIRKSPKQAGYFDLFRNRVIFPILNLRGKVAGFGGRVMDPQDSPKYLNSPESLVFHKNKLLYGLYQAQKHIREKDELILVEGYFDVLALHAAGFKNTVATCGTSLSPDHLRQFKRLASRVIVLFDGDRAGRTATERAMEVALEQGMILFGAEIPNGKDPDELVFEKALGKGGQPVVLSVAGQKQLEELLRGAESLLDRSILSWMKNSGQNPEDRTQALKKIGNWLSSYQDKTGKEVRLQLLETQWGVPKQWTQEIRRQTGAPAVNLEISKDQKPHRTQALGAQVLTAKKLGPVDRVLIQSLSKGGEYLACLNEARLRLPPGHRFSDLIEYPPAKELLGDRGLEQGFEWPEDVEIRSAVAEEAVSERPLTLFELKGALTKSLTRLWARFSQQIKRAIAEAEARKEAETQARLMKEYLDVQRKMKEFSYFYDEK